MFPFFNMYSSKAEQILSRYRPIAPKPPSSSGAAKPDQAPPDASAQSQSSVSVGCRKGGRKRSGDSSLGSPRGYKRSTASNRKQQQQQQQISHQIQAQQAQIQQQMVPVMADDVAIAAAAVAGSVSTVTSMASDAQALPGWKIVRPAPLAVATASIGGGSIDTNGYSKSPVEDAASTMAGKPGGAAGGRYELLRRISSGNSRVSSFNNDSPSPPRPPPPPPPPQPQISTSPPVDQQDVGSGGSGGGDDDRPKLVTLSLLPDTPAAAPAAATSTATATAPPPHQVDRARGGRSIRDRDRDNNNDARLELSLCSGTSSPWRHTAAPQPRTAEQRVPQFEPPGGGGSGLHCYQDGGGVYHHHHHHHHHQQQTSVLRMGQQQVIDTSYLEQSYGGSSDPVVLTDDCSSGGAAGSVVLWSNLSYNKVVSERLGGKPVRAAGPYIDPLGLPTQLGRFRYTQRGGECPAVLWGFLKKFMLLDHHDSSCSSSKLAAEIAEQTSSSIQQQQQQQHQQQMSLIAAPQPIRPPVKLPFGSNVSLDAITEVNSYSGYLSGSLEAVESQLERDGFPAFVTDRSNRVRWVNAAYNHLVRSSSGGSYQDSSCSNNAASATSAAAAAAAGSSASASAAPEMCVTFQTDRSPYSAVSLTGQARVDWSEGSKRCCLTGVPCEMRRLDDQHLGSLFVWKLNLTAGCTARYAVQGGGGGSGSGGGGQFQHEFYGIRERGFV